jgi:hypothetical protein
MLGFFNPYKVKERFPVFHHILIELTELPVVEFLVGF